MKIKRARKHTADLQLCLTEFGERVKIGLQPVGESEHHITYVVLFTEEPPDDVPMLIGDALHNLRASLDIMICDIARLRGKSADKLKFPFAPDAETLDKYLRKDFPRLGSDVVEAIRGLAPYTGGNIALRGLHDLDIDDKHETVLPYYLVAHSRVMVPDHLNMMMMEHVGFHFGQATMPLRAGSTAHIKKGHDPWGMVQPIPGPPQPTFPDGLPFAGQPVLKILERLADYVDQVVEAFAREFAEAGTGLDDKPVCGG